MVPNQPKNQVWFQIFVKYLLIYLISEAFHLVTKPNKPNIASNDCLILTRISTVLSSWDSPMYAFPPSTFQRNRQKNAFAKTHAFQKTELKAT